MNDIDKMMSAERFLQEVCKMMVENDTPRVELTVTTKEGTIVPLYIALNEEAIDNDY